MQTMLKATVCVILILFNVSLAYAADKNHVESVRLVGRGIIDLTSLMENPHVSQLFLFLIVCLFIWKKDD